MKSMWVEKKDVLRTDERSKIFPKHSSKPRPTHSIHQHQHCIS